MTIPPNHDADDLHAELDRLDRELEVLRTRLADDKGALLEAQARCRALRERSDPDPETNLGGRRMARTSRLASTRLSSRTAPVVLRAIAGGAMSRPSALTSAELATARARTALQTEEPDGPDAA